MLKRSLAMFLLLLIPFISFGADYLDELVMDVHNLSKVIVPVFCVPLPSFLLDEPVNRGVSRSNLFDFLNDLNLVHFTAIAVVSAAVAYPFDEYTAFTVIESFLTTAVFVGLVKFVVGRGRPYAENNPFIFKPFSLTEGYQSFPSGHSALSWSIFTPIAKRFGDVWYSIPLVFSAQRLWSNNHWLSDVMFGSSTGYYIADVFYSTKSPE
ncbi:MAG: phosphatase PAP2 family protein [Fervidobacterium sp.]|uniref:PAP2 superfamily protein n=1 Tax=Fervidobacterium gondwanense DSM 13020 TaxID=1121883 RepID=A0A1M7TA10_FERGO|nr:phosphatase PAP2 family protein [Fervidobacterium gondwanense]UXF01021.1 hypothetical protein IB67_05570 [Fervidobacterium riparium]SHN67544.1 PAP2 superfamily protein [Fervidobacterium gondwanense DSM 13020]